MKHFLTILLLAATTLVQAQEIQMTLFNGQSLFGVLESLSDTVLTIVNENNTRFNIPVSQVTKVHMSGKYKLSIVDGRFVLEANEHPTSQYASTRIAGDPNFAIGNALQSVGRTITGLGIPSLIAGAVLLGYGKGTIDAAKKGKTTLTDEQREVCIDCQLAGCVLLPFGGALTIVGIPLSVKGKQLMELKVNYTGNGAGLALAW